MKTTGYVCLAMLVCPAFASAEPPKLMAQLEYFEGKWRCEGVQHASPMGPEHKFVNKLDIQTDQGGFWEHFRLEQEKPQKGVSPIAGTIGVDDGKLVRDDFVIGGMKVRFSSDGFAGDSIVFDGKAKNVPWKHTMTKKSDKSFSSVFEVGGAPFIEESCTRRK
jgi:hypothetical protein